MNPSEVVTVFIQLIDVSIPDVNSNVTINFNPAGQRTMTIVAPYTEDGVQQIAIARPIIEAEVKTVFPNAVKFYYGNFGNSNPEQVAQFAERLGGRP